MGTRSAPSARKTPAHFSICLRIKCAPIPTFHISICEGTDGYTNECNFCPQAGEGFLQHEPARRETASGTDPAPTRSLAQAFGRASGTSCHRTRVAKDRRRCQRVHSSGHGDSAYIRSQARQKVKEATCDAAYSF